MKRTFITDGCWDQIEVEKVTRYKTSDGQLYTCLLEAVEAERRLKEQKRLKEVLEKCFNTFPGCTTADKNNFIMTVAANAKELKKILNEML